MGIDEARATADKLKKEKEAKEAAKEKGMVEAKTSIEELRANPAMMARFKRDANVGSENLGARMPVLKIYIANKSKSDILIDGKEPHNGWFILQSLGYEAETVRVHILDVSRGFKVWSMPDKEGKVRLVHQQIVSGMLIVGSELHPFMMYIAGSNRLQRLWKFGQDASRFTKRRDMPLPLFSMMTELSVETYDNGDFGKGYAPNYKLVVGEEHGQPIIALDEVKYDYLLSCVDSAKDAVAQIIISKEVIEKGKEEPATPIQEVKAVEPERIDAPPADDDDIPHPAEGDEVNPAAIPF